MAEIRVEPKRRSLAWLWILLALAAIAAVAWYLMNGGVRTVDDDAPAATTTSSLAAPTVALAAAPATVATPLTHPLAA